MLVIHQTKLLVAGTQTLIFVRAILLRGYAHLRPKTIYVGALHGRGKRVISDSAQMALNKRMLPDWFSAALQTSRKCERCTYPLRGSG